jgi:ribose 5-phosphate isomerase A
MFIFYINVTLFACRNKTLFESIPSSQSNIRLNNVITENDSINELDIYLEGCDQLDRDLNALKSGGGIYTREKLLASMAYQKN